MLNRSNALCVEHIVDLSRRVYMYIFDGKLHKGFLYTRVICIPQATEALIDGLVYGRSNSIANALELLQSCSKPSMLHIKWRLKRQ